MHSNPNPSSFPTPTAPGFVPSLPWAMRRIPAGGLHVAIYDSGSPGLPVPGAVPLLLVHSVHAAASAFEMEPVMLRQSRHRRVVAMDLPGFGASDRPDHAYTPAQMTAAILDVISAMGVAQVDVLALSLGCEFAAEAALARPAQVRSLALVSPTGMEDRRIGEKYDAGRTRAMKTLHRLLRNDNIGRGVYALLTTRLAMHHFLARTWGTRHYDGRLLHHGQHLALQHGARHAPLDFVSGALFTHGIVERYRALSLPVWVAHGRRGAFADVGACPTRTGKAATGGTFGLQRKEFDAGAMPHFELPEAFDEALFAFMRGLSLPQDTLRPFSANPSARLPVAMLMKQR